MKQLLHTIYTLVVCALLLPCGAFASDQCVAAEQLSDHALTMQVAQAFSNEQSAPKVEVRDGSIIPLCEYEQMQVFNVMGQEVRLSLIHISEPTRLRQLSRMPSSA